MSIYCCNRVGRVNVDGLISCDSSKIGLVGQGGFGGGIPGGNLVGGKSHDRENLPDEGIDVDILGGLIYMFAHKERSS